MRKVREWDEKGQGNDLRKVRETNKRWHFIWDLIDEQEFVRLMRRQEDSRYWEENSGNSGKFSVLRDMAT